MHVSRHVLVCRFAHFRKKAASLNLNRGSSNHEVIPLNSSRCYSLRPTLIDSTLSRSSRQWQIMRSSYFNLIIWKRDEKFDNLASYIIFVASLQVVTNIPSYSEATHDASRENVKSCFRQNFILVASS
jgi:hypothetical protein